MPTAEEAFLQAIREHPDDDGPRLMYADWLTERGDPKGEFIKIQCDLAGMAATDPRRPMLGNREQELLSAHREAWERPLRKLGAKKIKFRRGLPEGIAMQAEKFLENAEQLFALAPICSAKLLTEWDEMPQTLAASPYLQKLSELDLRDNFIHEAGAQALAESPYVAHLRRLDLACNRIGPAGARALAASSRLKNLTELDLGANGIGDEGAQALAGSPHLGKLTELCLAGNHISAVGVRELADSPGFARLTTLNLAFNHIRDEGADALADSPHLGNLTELILADCGISQTGTHRLAESPNLKGLNSLYLRQNGLGDAVLTEVERSLAARRAAREGRSL